MLAGIIALLNGAYVVGIVILATSISITALWMVMFMLSSKHTFQVPNVLEMLVIKLGKEKGTKIINQTNDWMEETCTMIRENIKTPESKKIFTVSFFLTGLDHNFFFLWIFYNCNLDFNY